jgi:hypothetical protein
LCSSAAQAKLEILRVLRRGNPQLVSVESEDPKAKFIKNPRCPIYVSMKLYKAENE